MKRSVIYDNALRFIRKYQHSAIWEFKIEFDNSILRDFLNKKYVEIINRYYFDEYTNQYYPGIKTTLTGLWAFYITFMKEKND